MARFLKFFDSGRSRPPKNACHFLSKQTNDKWLDEKQITKWSAVCDVAQNDEWKPDICHHERSRGI